MQSLQTFPPILYSETSWIAAKQVTISGRNLMGKTLRVPFHLSGSPQPFRLTKCHVGHVGAVSQ